MICIGVSDDSESFIPGNGVFLSSSVYRSLFSSRDVPCKVERQIVS